MLFVNSKWQFIDHWALVDGFDDSFDTLNLLSLNCMDHLFQLLPLDGNIGIAVFHVDSSNLISLQIAILAEKTYDVALGNLVILTLSNIEGAHLRGER